jgi:sulfate adenylyltransferase subunit 1
MDLVDFSEDVYNQIVTDLHAMVKEFGPHFDPANLVTIPVSALEGDNVVEPSTRTPWYTGPTLLEHLEQVPVQVPVGDLDPSVGVGFRLPIQRVIRPDQHFRGFAGQIAAGTIRKGDEIVALPSGRTSRVASITTFDGDLEQASAPQSVALALQDELDISRGDLLVTPSQRPHHATQIEATLVWFDAHRLESHKPYLLKHGAQILNVRIPRVLHRTNIHTLEQEAVHSLAMNDIGTVELATTRPLYFDPYIANRATGSFILIDPATNATVAAGMIRRGLDPESSNVPAHKSAILRISNPALAAAVEQLLLDANIPVVRTRVQSQSIWQSLLHLGIVAILDAVTGAKTTETEPQHEVLDASTSTPEAFLAELRERGILPAPKGAQQ